MIGRMIQRSPLIAVVRRWLLSFYFVVRGRKSGRIFFFLFPWLDPSVWMTDWLDQSFSAIKRRKKYNDLIERRKWDRRDCSSILFIFAIQSAFIALHLFLLKILLKEFSRHTDHDVYSLIPYPCSYCWIHIDYDWIHWDSLLFFVSSLIRIIIPNEQSHPIEMNPTSHDVIRLLSLHAFQWEIWFIALPIFAAFWSQFLFWIRNKKMRMIVSWWLPSGGWRWWRSSFLVSRERERDWLTHFLLSWSFKTIMMMMMKMIMITGDCSAGSEKWKFSRWNKTAHRLMFTREKVILMMTTVPRAALLIMP